MIARRRRTQLGAYLVGDLIATTAAFLSAFWLRFQTGWFAAPLGVPLFDRYVDLLPALLVLWPIAFYFQGLYQMRRSRTRFDMSIKVFLAVALASVLLSAGLTFYRSFSYSRAVLVLFALLDVAFVIAVRWLISQVMRTIRLSGGNLQRVLVVGAGELGRQVVDRIRDHREYGFEIVGFLDDDPGKQKRKIMGVPVLGSSDELEAVIEDRQVDQVILALPLAAHTRTVQMLQRAGPLLVDVKVVPDLLQYYVLRCGIEDFDGLPIINLTEIPLQGFNQLVKRAIDIAGALVGLGLLLPFLPFLAWLIKHDDPGPIFYRQERMGLDGRPFNIWKIRTMRITADEGRQWTRSNDTRVTELGAFLRSSSIDELPQLWNVLRGEMSLVGPRPEQPKFVNEFRERYPEYMDRHRVRSGLTGWAQVNGLRGDTSIRKRMTADLYYVENWSLALDLKILWLTLKTAWKNPKEG